MLIFCSVSFGTSVQAFLNEKKQRSRDRVSMTVLRNDRPVNIFVPPLMGLSLVTSCHIEILSWQLRGIRFYSIKANRKNTEWP